MRVDGILKGDLIEHLVEKSNVVWGLRAIAGSGFGILASALATVGITATTAWIASTSARPSPSASSVTAVAAARRGLSLLFRSHSDVPLAACGVGIDGDDAILIGGLVEQSEARHVVGILILPMQKDHEGIVLLLVVALGQVQDIAAGDVIDVDFLPGFLSGRRG